MIQKIREFMLPEKSTEMFKKEAMSSMELVRRVGIKLNEVIKVVNEFTTARDNKYQEQDGKIQKAIIYMKHNIKNTLAELIRIMRSNGELSEVISEAVFEGFEYVKNATDDIVRPENFGAIGNRNNRRYTCFTTCDR